LTRSRVAGQRRAGGFTLIELVIAFSLTALIALLLFSGLRLGMRSWETVEVTAEKNAELRIARGFLERALGQSRTVVLTLDAEPVLLFGGDAENLEFVAPLSEHAGVPGLYILRFSLGEGDSRRLVLTRWLLHPDVLEGTAEIPEWEPFDGGIGASFAGAEDRDIAEGVYGSTVLVEDVEELRFDYFGPVNDGLSAAVGDDLDADWQEDWIERSSPPLALRIHLTTAERSWPDAIVTLPVADGSR
jgi:general secretion pathway protein J